MESSSPRYASRCAVCGKPARVFLGSTSYCQDCYNRLADYLAGVETPTNDSYQILALDPAGHTVEFSVERYSFGARSVWTAVEQVPADDPRREWGYVGRSVSIAVDAARVSQDEAYDALMVKVQHVVDHASMRTVPISLGPPRTVLGGSAVRCVSLRSMRKDLLWSHLPHVTPVDARSAASPRASFWGAPRTARIATTA